MAQAKAKSNGDAPAPESNGVGGNKMEAVRRALKVLGRDATPSKLHHHILDTFHLDIKPNMISSYKSTILKSNGAPAGKRGRKPKSASAADAAVGVSLKDLKAIKELTNRLGAGRVRELVELLT